MKALIFIIFIFGGINLLAQPEITFYNDFGKTNMSEGLFLKTAITGQYKYEKYILNSGAQFDLISNSEKVLKGFKINAGREFSIKNFPLEWHIFYLWTGISANLKESNFGTFAKHNWDHFEILLGTNFRTYAFTKQAIRHYEFDNESPLRIHENWNLMYNFSFYLKPITHYWNLGISLTDIDHFNISQETNPFMYINGKYELNQKLDLFSEIWIKTAGSFNLRIDYFGFFIRTGILWDIN